MSNSDKFFADHFETPLGLMEVVASNSGVRSIHFVEQTQSVKSNIITDDVQAQLLDYFTGEREIFELPLEPMGTDFQQRVWCALSDIEFGKTCSYRDIAKQIDNPKGMRAVGLANGKNPLTIVVPCHRVIGANGSLTGYASGVERKDWLLRHERLTFV